MTAPLVVEVRDSSGRPVSGVQVRFTAPPPAGAADSLTDRRGMFVCSTNFALCSRYFDSGFEVRYQAVALDGFPALGALPFPYARDLFLQRLATSSHR